MVNAAVRLINERGILGTTLKAVGEAAGYSRGLATYQYGSKSGLMRAVTKTLASTWIDCVTGEVGDKTGVDALCAVIDAHYRFIHDMPAEFRTMTTLACVSIDPGSGIQARVSEVHHKQRHTLAQWIKGGQAAGTCRGDVEPARMAEQTLATLAGIGMQWMVNPDVPLHAMHEQFKQNIRFMLSPDASAYPAAPSER
jgi:AcrR family transcriptional regulator